MSKDISIEEENFVEFKVKRQNNETLRLTTYREKQQNL